MSKLLSLLAGILLALTVYTTSADASVYGGVYIGVPPVYVGPGYRYHPYYRTYYYPRYYYPHRHYYRPYRHYYRHGPYYRHW